MWYFFQYFMISNNFIPLWIGAFQFYNFRVPCRNFACHMSYGVNYYRLLFFYLTIKNSVLSVPVLITDSRHENKTQTWFQNHNTNNNRFFLSITSLIVFCLNVSDVSDRKTNAHSCEILLKLTTTWSVHCIKVCTFLIKIVQHLKLNLKSRRKICSFE